LGQYLPEPQDALAKGIQTLLETSPAKKVLNWHVLQYHHFHQLMLSPNESVENIAAIANFLVEQGALGAAILAYTNHQVDKAHHLLDKCHQGDYCSEAAFARAYCDAAFGSLMDGLPDFLIDHFDYHAMGKVLLTTDFFSVWADNQQHIFEHADSE